MQLRDAIKVLDSDAHARDPDIEIKPYLPEPYRSQRAPLIPGEHYDRNLGGTLGRREATGRGVVYMIMEAAKHLGIDLSSCTAVVQGFGNVGSIAVRELANIGVKIIGVSDQTGGFYDPKGLPVERLLELADKNRSLEDCPYGEKITNQELLELKCGILVPAALEMQINKDNVARLQCRILAEGANGPTTLEADAALKERNVFVIPDILANAGGVVVSYFEWVQDLQNFFWTEEEVNKKLRDILVKAFHQVLNLSQKHQVDMRLAALMIGIERVARAMLWRGLYA